MTIAITIHTYQRADGQTPNLLLNTLKSVANQTYQDFKLFIVGDKYEDNAEFESIMAEIPELQGKIIFENLSFANERDKYLNVDNTALWNCGGANAINHANNLARHHGYTKVCHIDHDDIWLPNHLKVIVDAIAQKGNPAFMHTLSKYLHHPIFPHMVIDGEVIEHYPAYCQLIHSSTYMDLEQLADMPYRDMFALENRYFPSDGDLWERIRERATAENLKCYVIREVTCIHDNENY